MMRIGGQALARHWMRWLLLTVVAMLDLKPIVRAILSKYMLPRDGTHGVHHWARVLQNGLRLAEESGADVEVVQLFAIFHDSQRINEGIDDGHGRRGAELAASFHGRLFTLSNYRFRHLHEACAHHTDGKTEADVTIQTCWDSDRLDLGRLGIFPDLNRLCTPAARRPEILNAADGRTCLRVIPAFVHHWGIDDGV